ncbi:hypothetical protein MHYP_G00332720 [Metynnis hypsauchen]
MLLCHYPTSAPFPAITFGEHLSAALSATTTAQACEAKSVGYATITVEDVLSGVFSSIIVVDVTSPSQLRSLAIAGLDICTGWDHFMSNLCFLRWSSDNDQVLALKTALKNVSAVSAIRTLPFFGMPLI